MPGKVIRGALAMGLILALLCLPAAQAAEVQPEEPSVTLNLNRANIVDVLNTLAQRHQRNIVIGPGVSGEVSVNLHQMGLAEAIRAVASAGGYSATYSGGVHFVSKPASTTKPEMPTDIRTVRLNYADVDEAAMAITGTTGSEVKTYKATRTLVIRDTPENLERAEQIAKAVDVVPRQVLIEAQILEVSLTDELAYGVDWKKVFSWGGTFETQGFSIPPATPGATGLFFNVIRPGDRFEFFFDALKTQTDVDLIATPKLLALDHTMAEILIGERLGYKTAFISETSTTETVAFLDVGTELKLTPHIGEDGTVVMQLFPKVSDGVITAGIPSETTTQVSTTVLARDGETIFIAGLIRTKQKVTEQKVPILGSIPGLGILFKRHEDRTDRSEIVVFITPHIVGEGGTAGEAPLSEDEEVRPETVEPEAVELGPAEGGHQALEQPRPLRLWHEPELGRAPHPWHAGRS